MYKRCRVGNSTDTAGRFVSVRGCGWGWEEFGVIVSGYLLGKRKFPFREKKKFWNSVVVMAHSTVNALNATGRCTLKWLER